MPCHITKQLLIQLNNFGIKLYVNLYDGCSDLTPESALEYIRDPILFEARNHSTDKDTWLEYKDKRDNDEQCETCCAFPDMEWEEYLKAGYHWKCRNCLQKNLSKPKRKPKKGYVYVIKSSNGYFKIGRTDNPNRRLNELRNKVPGKIKVIHLIKTYDCIGTERCLHEKFIDKHVNGEWFELSEKDIVFLKRLNNFEELIDIGGDER